MEPALRSRKSSDLVEDLGMDSVGAVNLIAAIEDAVGGEVIMPIELLFQITTVRDAYLQYCALAHLRTRAGCPAVSGSIGLREHARLSPSLQPGASTCACHQRGPRTPVPAVKRSRRHIPVGIPRHHSQL